MAITTNTVNTVFPNSSPDIDRIIISFEDDDESLVKLCCVNKAANQIITNIFFKARFDAQHPVLVNIPLKFEKLCNFFPDSCWKIACCAFAKGRLKLSLSHTFISEYSPNIHKFILSEKTKTETEHREICGSFCQDPNSQIDQAWKAHAAIKQLQITFDQRLEPIELEAVGLFNQFFENHPEIPQRQIILILSTFSIIVNSYTDAQILNPSDEVTIAIHDDMFNALKKEAKDTKSDDEIRELSDLIIAQGLSDFNTLLSSDSHSTRRICQLISETRLLLENKGFVIDHQRNDIYDAQKKYEKLEEKRTSCVNKLGIIGEQLGAFDSSGKIPLNRTVLRSGATYCFDRDNPHTSHYFDVLVSEAFRAQRGEIALMRLPLLLECSSLIQNLRQHPEETSPAALDRICQMINSCEIEDIGRIWGRLYEDCANGVHEDKWSEKHFPEFLGELGGIVASVIRHYSYDSERLTEPGSKDFMSRFK